LLYSEEFNGTFYRGLRGENLLYYIRHQEADIVTEIVSEAAKIFARLHSLPNVSETNFNLENSRIKTVVPGITKIFREMGARYNNKYNDDLVKLYDYFIEHEEAYFSKGGQSVLIHGDAHPENIIRTAPNHLGLIDFTDLCLGDRARDIGTFIQQLEYKIRIRDEAWSNKMKDLFLATYLKEANLDLSADLQARINLYYNWTAIRTATYWFLKFDYNEKSAKSLLEEVKNNLKSELK